MNEPKQYQVPLMAEEPLLIGEFDVRTATPKQQAQLFDLHHLLRKGTAQTSYEGFVAENLGKGEKLVVAQNTFNDIQAMIIVDVQNDSAWIRHNVVHVSTAGQGLGKRMLDEAIAVAKKTGAKEVFLHCNPVPERDAARAIYLSRGFKNLGLDTAAKTVTEKFVLSLA